MKTYLDCGSGVAGDMLLGALVDLGLSPKELEKVLHQAIPVRGWRLRFQHTERQKWPARSLHVEGDRPFGSPEKMKRVIRDSKMPRIVKERALSILSSLQWAESQAHGHRSSALMDDGHTPRTHGRYGHGNGDFDPDGIGLLDTLVDVLGNTWAFWRMGIENLTASTINTGRIAPATIHLVSKFKIPTFSADQRHELATPTGVAILGCLATRFAPMPTLQLKAAGYGAGHGDFPGRPNILALYQGDTLAAQPGTWNLEPVLALETAIDDMDPRLYSHVSDLLFKAGALDLWWVSAGMKKGRPGILYTVLCHPNDESQLLKILFQETTTLGVRRQPMDRWILPRHHKGIRKVAELPGGFRKSQVEYEMARHRAQARSIPLKKLLK